MRHEVFAVLGSVREAAQGVRVDPIDQQLRPLGLQIQRFEQALQVPEGEKVGLAVGAHEIVEIEPALQVFKITFDRSAVDGQRR